MMTIQAYFDWEFGEYAELKTQAPDFRLGQAFINHFDKTGDPPDFIFWEADTDKCRDLIFKYYQIG